MKTYAHATVPNWAKLQVGLCQEPFLMSLLVNHYCFLQIQLSSLDVTLSLSLLSALVPHGLAH